MLQDLFEQAPIWPFSSYAPEKSGPYSENIISGVEISPEELRWEALTSLKRDGNLGQYVS